VQDEQNLREEIEHFRSEQERIRGIIGSIGGRNRAKTNKIINLVFIIFIAVLFAVDLFRHFVVVGIPLPPLFLMEVSILLISVKIVWMIHQQTRVDHFQFWMLHSIEFRLNDMAKRMQHFEKKLQSPQDSP
jgi:hypothetical protein